MERLESRIRKLERQLLVGDITLEMSNGSIRRIPGGYFVVQLFCQDMRERHAVLVGKTYQPKFANELAAIRNSVSDDSSGGLLDYIRMEVKRQ